MLHHLASQLPVRRNAVILTGYQVAGTRGAALIASGSMAFAYFDIHQQHALLPIQNGGEPAVMFCWAFLLLVFTGSGAFGLDRLFVRRAAAQDERVPEQAPIAA